ncbi:Heterokaryon incompatibility protein 6, OR allele [Fulvia fulva]|uniref:Heterokaryon incompatibility protein 6, OR allele n=1 Tax=Passalora fulva TaxID=5499 RepID=A0A9Q8LE10_PASFU|nr:Heterokaryon incompatibility protein 6, OR allele [Fulvia fulva]KAK4629203.1 Heterokaryon incompatibility protein 6, OR allele [Fulvia fulva]KAK4629789.1 Heterokaryon incompatibility protein 6, OR allele [Fulvia fulva]UJO14963.1 Heterokaryon incompatibility protein 6, OR allele [Fulvia fulva]WPV12850.1 Heterokaryon incompatibility protein 6, OR allele [Fulvia fulva]WPV27617.1 Heterokaryon incompatibility protein 6, OR allele [Fulvia fulva]
MGTYQYTPLPEGKHIRVLTILPNAAKRPRIDCTIETVTLDASSNYTALSYTWGMNEDGDASLCEELYISNQRLPITRNLYQGLLRIREKTTPVRMWIDAVCINQQDIPERNAQVRFMPSIFSEAAAVVVWLGEGTTEQDDEDAASLFDVMAGAEWDLSLFCDDDASQVLSGQTRSPIRGNFDIEDRLSSLDRCSTGIIVAMRALAGSLNWCAGRSDMLFSTLVPRDLTMWQHWMSLSKIIAALWELYHARPGAVVMRWGHCILDLQHFRDASATWYSFAGVSRRYASRPNESDRSSGEDLLHQIQTDMLHRNMFNFPDCVTVPALGQKQRLPESLLIHLLRIYSHLRCLDDRDKLFALVSLVPSAEVELPVDYSLNFTQVCIKFTIWLLRKGHLAIVLHQLGLTTLDSELPPLNAPSWTFNLRKRIYTTAESDNIPVHRVDEAGLLCSMIFAGTITNIDLARNTYGGELEVVDSSGTLHTVDRILWDSKLKLQSDDCLFVPVDAAGSGTQYGIFMRRALQHDRYRIVDVAMLRASDLSMLDLGHPEPVMID